jgi:putative flippase GtrA
MTSFLALIDKFRRYLMVGAFNTGLCFLVMYAGSSVGLGYLIYTALGYLTTIVLSFFMNLHYTFKVKDRAGIRLMGFVTVSLVNLSIVELIEYTLIESFSFVRWIAILIGMGWYVSTGFLMNNYVVYRRVHVAGAQGQ